MNSYEQRQADKKERLEQAAAKRHADASAKLSQVRALGSVIPFGQPVIGARDRAFRERLHRSEGVAHRTEAEAKSLEVRAAAVGTAGIASDDPEAVVKLKEELGVISKRIEHMKAVNKQFKKGGAESLEENERKNWERLKGLFPYYSQPYQSFSLTNAGANRRRIEKRIEALTRHSEAAPLNLAGPGWTMTEDRDAGRIILDFGGVRLESEKFKKVRSFGFLWSRNQEKFVRKITPNAIGSAKVLAKALEA